MDLKIIDEFKYHLLTNNNGYINETADTVNENEVFQFRGQYRLTTVIRAKLLISYSRYFIYVLERTQEEKYFTGINYHMSTCICNEHKINTTK